VRDDVEVAGPGTARLPATAVAALREAFAGEVAERLPRLRAAADSGDPALLAAAVRDAHALGSSSVVVGEADASRCARAAERVLLEWQADAATDPIPALRGAVDALHASLSSWLR
jgi:HPt (histidine-containing phosphotransfer) domain-containing protein